MKRFICLLLCTAVVFTLAAPAAKAALPAPNPVVRIGLAVGSSALAAASLEPLSGGTGYAFGYLDADRKFIELGRTDQTKITVTKNRNVYLVNGKYTDTASDSPVVGAYHDRLGGPYATRGEAEDAAISLSAQGIAVFLSFSSGSWLVNSGSYADSGGGTRWTGSKYAVSVVTTGTTDIIFQFDYNETYSLCVRPLAAEGEKPITRFNGYRYYGSFEFRRFDGNLLYVYNAVEMQDYIKGVVPYEMNYTWPLEALKAQSVSARSFTVANLGRHKAAGYDLCPSTCCQVYYGTAQANATTDRAVDETYGMYLTYNETVCNTSYHASNGGATENSENVWTAVTPYLRGVVDPYEDASKISGYNWQYTLTNDQISAWLNRIGKPNTGVSRFYVSKSTDMGNVYSITFLDNSGKEIVTFSKESARTQLRSLVGASPNVSLSQRYAVISGDMVLAATGPGGTPMPISGLSSLYAIDGTGNVTQLLPQDVYVISSGGQVSGLPQSTGDSDTYTVIGRGNGHNVGMSQQGAKGMAERGFTYDQILAHYFTGVTISYTG